MKILFVCRGNVGRSQMAEAIFKQLNNLHDARSAGTKVVSPTTGESRHGQLLKDTKGAENVVMVLKDKGIEVRESSRTQLQPDLIDWADKVICMAEEETVPDYVKKSPKVTYWKIVDPKGTTYEAHMEIFEQIEHLVKEFITKNKLQ